MTKEERIKLINHLKYSRSIGADYLITDDDVDEIIKVLEQEPCEDCVSRQAVLSKIKEVCLSEEWLQFRVDNGSNGQRNFLINYIEQLPPVTPKQEPVIDKIRKEIIDWQTDIHDNEYDANKFDFVFERILEIIDEYKAESEEQDDSN